MMKKVLLIMSAVILLAACSQNAKKEGGTVVQPAASTGAGAEQMETTPMPEKLMPVDTTKVIPAIAEKYSGAVIDVLHLGSEKIESFDVPFSTKVPLTGTPYSIEVMTLFTDFTMVDGGEANKSLDESNPGVKVNIYRDGKVVFNKWLFQNFPTMHGFVDPDGKVGIIMKATKLK